MQPDLVLISQDAPQVQLETSKADRAASQKHIELDNVQAQLDAAIWDLDSTFSRLAEVGLEATS